MAYPEKTASYRNKPAWMDRAVAGEKHAQGGPVSIGNRSVGNGAGVRDIADAATEDAADNLQGAMRVEQHKELYDPEKSGKHFWDSGSRIPGQFKAMNDRYEAKVRGRNGGGSTC